MRPDKESPWPEKDDDLRRLWGTMSTIAIGKKLGVSKNAVVGRSYRLNLPRLESPIQRTGRPKKMKGPLPKPPPLADLVAIGATAEIVTISARAPAAPSRATAAPVQAGPRPEEGSRFACLWPVGEPGRPGFHYCGERVLVGRPYCPEHHATATIHPRSLVRVQATLATIQQYAADHRVTVPIASGIGGLVVATNNHRRAAGLVPFALRASAA